MHSNCSIVRDDCAQMIEDYATGGDGFLTEDKMRKACGLELRVRHQETAMGGVGLLHVSDSQEERDLEEKQYTALRDRLVEHMLETCVSDITIWEFKRFHGSVQNQAECNSSNNVQRAAIQKLYAKRLPEGEDQGSSTAKNCL